MTRAASASAVVGMVGAGQLARMTHQAAIALGIELVVLGPSPSDPAVLAGARHVDGSPDDPGALADLAAQVDVVTLDHELVDIAGLATLEDAGHLVRPGPEVLRLAQDKAHARTTLAARGFPVPAAVHVPAGDVDAVHRFAAEHGWPIVLKAPTGGYDGRGVDVLGGPDALERSPVARTARSWLLEEHVEIQRELAVLVVRRPSGASVTYPVVETVQRDGICNELFMPARLDGEVRDAAVALARSIAETIEVVGILAVELFVTPRGSLVVNELAVRPHNSGHATIDASVTSQFENHLRAVLDWPLGATDLVAPAAAMVNLLGARAEFDPTSLPGALVDPGVRVHLYAKSWAPGRKLGHLTVCAPTVDEAMERAQAAAAKLVGVAAFPGWTATDGDNRTNHSEVDP